MRTEARRVEKRWLLVPSSSGGSRHKVCIEAAGGVLHAFETPLAERGEVEWWAAVDMRGQLGEELFLSSDSETFFELLQFSDEPPAGETLYREKRRPQFHFSPRRGWLNDPNGLVYFRGEYHLFFQYNPYFTEWGNMHWGHAVSRDLVHWRELDIALYPDEHGAMFSGSAVWDRFNSSGLHESGPMILLYTGAQERSVQCLAWSADGRQIAKLPGNPVLPALATGNRDPKVFWHLESARWIMALYVPAEREGQVLHTVHFLSSLNLIDWRPESVVSGGVGEDTFLFECPDLFPLPLSAGVFWVLLGANGEYVLGDFDGQVFRPSSPRRRGIPGAVFYAGQTYHDEPLGRRVLIAWLRSASPGMPFNQCMSLPLELSLVQTAEGPLMASRPVAEFERLRHTPRHFAGHALAEGEALFSLEMADGFEAIVYLEEGSAGQFTLTARGVAFHYCGATRELRCGDLCVDVPRVPGPLEFRLIGDRTTLELFVAGGLIYWPLNVVADLSDNLLRVVAQEDVTHVASATVFDLASSWPSAGL